MANQLVQNLLQSLLGNTATGGLENPYLPRRSPGVQQLQAMIGPQQVGPAPMVPQDPNERINDFMEDELHRMQIQPLLQQQADRQTRQLDNAEASSKARRDARRDLARQNIEQMARGAGTTPEDLIGADESRAMGFKPGGGVDVDALVAKKRLDDAMAMNPQYRHMMRQAPPAVGGSATAGGEPATGGEDAPLFRIDPDRTAAMLKHWSDISAMNQGRNPEAQANVESLRRIQEGNPTADDRRRWMEMQRRARLQAEDAEMSGNGAARDLARRDPDAFLRAFGKSHYRVVPNGLRPLTDAEKTERSAAREKKNYSLAFRRGVLKPEAELFARSMGILPGANTGDSLMDAAANNPFVRGNPQALQEAVRAAGAARQAEANSDNKPLTDDEKYLAIYTSLIKAGIDPETARKQAREYAFGGIPVPPVPVAPQPAPGSQGPATPPAPPPNVQRQMMWK